MRYLVSAKNNIFTFFRDLKPNWTSIFAYLKQESLYTKEKYKALFVQTKEQLDTDGEQSTRPKLSFNHPDKYSFFKNIMSVSFYWISEGLLAFLFLLKVLFTTFGLIDRYATAFFVSVIVFIWYHAFAAIIVGIFLVTFLICFLQSEGIFDTISEIGEDFFDTISDILDILLDPILELVDLILTIPFEILIPLVLIGSIIMIIRRKRRGDISLRQILKTFGLELLARMMYLTILLMIIMNYVKAFLER